MKGNKRPRVGTRGTQHAVKGKTSGTKRGLMSKAKVKLVGTRHTEHAPGGRTKGG